jgi:hypothetical protein
MRTTIAPPVSACTVSAVPCSKQLDVPVSADLARIRREYVEMPGLLLTLPQAARLWDFSSRRAAELLAVLVDSGFLACDKEAVYRRQR